MNHFDEELKDDNGEELDVLTQPYVVDGTSRYVSPFQSHLPALADLIAGYWCLLQLRYQ